MLKKVTFVLLCLVIGYPFALDAQEECDLPENYTQIAFAAINSERFDEAISIFTCAIESGENGAEDYCL
ncbi:MAG: hypothetical protein AAFR81_05285 [Chloroflexota bacterium]